VPQNGDELLESPQFVNVIDGFGKEELLYGEHEPEERNSPASLGYALQRLHMLTRAGKPAFVVEYTTNPDLAASILKEIRQLGFIGHVANRDLTTLSSPVAGCARPDC
jgi:uncharacterized protein (TIGR01370 family)